MYNRLGSLVDAYIFIKYKLHQHPKVVNIFIT